MTLRERGDVRRALALLEDAKADLRRGLDHGSGEHFWNGYQAQALRTIRQVARAIHTGSFELPHPWDLTKHDRL